MVLLFAVSRLRGLEATRQPHACHEPGVRVGGVHGTNPGFLQRCAPNVNLEELAFCLHQQTALKTTSVPLPYWKSSARALPRTHCSGRCHAGELQPVRRRHRGRVPGSGQELKARLRPHCLDRRNKNKICRSSPQQHCDSSFQNSTL